MCRKIGLAAVLAVAGLFVLSMVGFKASHVTTAWNKLRGNIKNQVPIEFEIERLRTEVAQLGPEMSKHVSVIAQEHVAVEGLKKEIESTRDKLTGQEAALRQMSRDLESGVTSIKYNGRDYTPERIAKKLEQDFTSFQRAQAELKSKEKLLEAKEKALENAREQMNAMKALKQDMELELAALEAEVKALRVAQTNDKFHLDDSKLSQCKATLVEIRNRLNVEQKTVELNGQFANDPAVKVEAPKAKRSPKEVARDISAQLNGGEPKGERKIVEKK
jgi:peptidoglycan hydrolase CwlO-like protein